MARIAIIKQFPARKLDHFNSPETSVRVTRPQDCVDSPVERGFPVRVFETARGRSRISGSDTCEAEPEILAKFASERRGCRTHCKVDKNEKRNRPTVVNVI